MTTVLPSTRLTARLHPFPGTGGTSVHGLMVTLGWTVKRELALAYRLEGDLGGIVLPPPQPPGFADGLWQHTCFEAFVAPAEAPAYREFNFSPSSAWAGYAFSAYREGGDRLDTPPHTVFRRTADRLELDVLLPPAALPLAANGWRLGLSAVIETAGGSRSYWALAHPAAQPDFHHRDAFVLSLPPAP